ncbi:MAG: ABC-type transport auxiliary lipoprotein family protein [Pseudomonadota bacterium]
MKRYYVFLLILTAILIVGCAIKLRDKHYVISYDTDDLEIISQRSVASDKQYNIEVREFEIRKIFDTNNLIVFKFPDEIQFDDDNKWAIKLDVMITDLFIKHLNSKKGIYAYVSDLRSEKPNYFIRGKINNMEIRKVNEKHYPYIDIELSVYNKKKELFIRDNIKITKAFNEFNMDHFVEYMASDLKAEFDLFINNFMKKI